MKMALIFSLLFSASFFGWAPRANASDAKYPNGIQMEIAAGAGQSQIGNPDNTTAFYNALTIEGRGHLPLIGGNPDDRFAFDLTGGVRYLDLKNTAEIGSQREYANLIGPGAGVHMRLFKFVVGAEYDFMFARHYAVGPVSRELQYSTTMAKYYGGLVFPLQQLSISLLYSSASAVVPHDRSGLSVDSNYTDQVYMLNFTYSTGASFGNFVKYLF